MLIFCLKCLSFKCLSITERQTLVHCTANKHPHVPLCVFYSDVKLSEACDGFLSCKHINEVTNLLIPKCDSDIPQCLSECINTGLLKPCVRLPV